MRSPCPQAQSQGTQAHTAPTRPPPHACGEFRSASAPAGVETSVYTTLKASSSHRIPATEKPRSCALSTRKASAELPSSKITEQTTNAAKPRPSPSQPRTRGRRRVTAPRITPGLDLPRPDVPRPHRQHHHPQQRGRQAPHHQRPKRLGFEQRPAALHLLHHPDRHRDPDHGPRRVGRPVQPEGESAPLRRRRIGGAARRGAPCAPPSPPGPPSGSRPPRPTSSPAGRTAWTAPRSRTRPPQATLRVPSRSDRPARIQLQDAGRRVGEPLDQAHRPDPHAQHIGQEERQHVE